MAQDLLRKIILNNPTLNCIFRGRKDAWEGLPRNKSLFYSAEGCGLPIGNLTSQLFSNVYLSSFDNLMKRKEGLKYYGRYVDDMIIVHRSRKYLLELKDRMAYILSNDYGLGTVLFLSTSTISCCTFDCRPPKKQGLTVESLLCI